MAKSQSGRHHAPVLLSIISEIPNIKNAKQQMIAIFRFPFWT
jgi:hypothetical protein